MVALQARAECCGKATLQISTQEQVKKAIPDAADE